MSNKREVGDERRLISLPHFEKKIVAPESLEKALTALPRPWVFTNGCFDILHRGHVTYLAQAAALGHSLIVAINSDASVRTLAKGAERPLNPLADRLAVLAALESVALVTWFEEATPLALIARLCPDILVKGGDWPVEKIVGGKETLARGGEVHSIPFLHDRSTTRLVAAIKNLPPKKFD